MGSMKKLPKVYTWNYLIIEERGKCSNPMKLSTFTFPSLL